MSPRRRFEHLEGDAPGARGAPKTQRAAARFETLEQPTAVAPELPAAAPSAQARFGKPGVSQASGAVCPMCAAQLTEHETHCPHCSFRLEDSPRVHESFWRDPLERPRSPESPPQAAAQPAPDWSRAWERARPKPREAPSASVAGARLVDAVLSPRLRHPLLLAGVVVLVLLLRELNLWLYAHGWFGR